MIHMEINSPNVPHPVSRPGPVWQPLHYRETIMPRGDKSAYTDTQKRKAEHIMEGYRDKGVPKEEAEKRAWATVNKEDGGGRKSGSGRAHHPGKS